MVEIHFESGAILKVNLSIDGFEKSANFLMEKGVENGGVRLARGDDFIINFDKIEYIIEK